MLKRRKATHHNADYWQAHISACEQSGLTQQQYCHKNNLTVSTYYRWKKKFKSNLNSPVDFESLNIPSLIEVPINVLQSEPDDHEDERMHWDMELSLGHGITLKLRHR